MSSNKNPPNVTKTLDPAAPPPRDAIVAKLTISTDADAPAPANDTTSDPVNDNATRGGALDTTPLVARPDVVKYVRATLVRYGVASQDMPDAIADVQADAIEAARSGRMPACVDEWKALAVTIAARWAIDRLREAESRGKYDAGLCEDADRYMRPTLHWEHRDPVDTKRYLAVLKDLFDSGQMPEDGEEILQAEADEVPHAEIAAELGISETVVDNRLYRMRAKFRAKLITLGLLTLLMLLLAALASVGGTGRAPQMDPGEPTEPVRHLPESGAIAPPATNSTSPVRGNRALAD
jgi:DNA-directed RNA polymerase specialized sigma24 family protein